MSFAFIFWLLMLFWLIFGFIWNYRPGTWGSYGWAGNALLLFVLLGLLGWATFGPPIHG